MPVEIGDVDVLAGDEPREPAREDGAGGTPHHAAQDPLLAVAIANAVALQRSRDQRLRAD
jgi:hypothetical protein